MCPSLIKRDLYKTLSDDLGDGCAITDHSYLPYKVEIKKTAEKFAIYLWNILESGSTSIKRPKNEYKINFDIQNIDLSSEYFPIILGYSDDYGIYVLWDGSRYKPTTGKRNIQVKIESMLEALTEGISYHYRMTLFGIEKVIICTKDNLVQALSERKQLYIDELVNDRPFVQITKLPHHANYSDVYLYCRDHPDYTSFELSKKLNMSMETIKTVLNYLSINKDVPRDYFDENERQLIEEKVRIYLSTHPHAGFSTIERELYIPRDYLEENNLLRYRTIEDFI